MDSYPFSEPLEPLRVRECADCNDGYDDYQTEYCNLRGDGIVEPYDVEHPEERVRRVAWTLKKTR